MLWVVRTLDAGDDGSLLNRRRLLEPVRVDASEQFLLQVHVVEVISNLVPVALQTTNTTIEGQNSTGNSTARNEYTCRPCTHFSCVVCVLVFCKYSSFTKVTKLALSYFGKACVF